MIPNIMCDNTNFSGLKVLEKHVIVFMKVKISVVINVTHAVTISFEA